MTRQDLARIFVDHLPGELRAQAPALAEIADQLARLLEEARAAWPDARMTDPDLVAYLAERLAPERSCLESLQRIAAADLLLASGCARSEEWALDAFETKHVPELRAAVGAARLPGVIVDEVIQSLRERLFVEKDGRRPRILDYAGRGPLGAWLRIAATRAAVSMFRRARLETPASGERLAHHLEREFDPELGYLKEMYREQFAQAFRAAVEALETRERSLLRYHYLDGLTLQEVGRIYGVHRATVARWIAAAKEKAMGDMLSVLRRGIGVSDSEFASLVQLMRSQLDISIRRLFSE